MARLVNSAMLSQVLVAKKKAAEKTEETAAHRPVKSRLLKVNQAVKIQSLENPASVPLLIANKRINGSKVPNKRYPIDLFGLAKLFSHRRYTAILR